MRTTRGAHHRLTYTPPRVEPVKARRPRPVAVRLPGPSTALRTRDAHQTPPQGEPAAAAATSTTSTRPLVEVWMSDSSPS